MQHTTTDGWNEGGVELGQLGVAAPGGWDQYSLFLSSSLPRSRVHEPHRTYTREPLPFFLFSFAFLFRGSPRPPSDDSPLPGDTTDDGRYLGNEGNSSAPIASGREGAGRVADCGTTGDNSVAGGSEEFTPRARTTPDGSLESRFPRIRSYRTMESG